jgi:hypothetical protein
MICSNTAEQASKACKEGEEEAKSTKGAYTTVIEIARRDRGV